MSPPTRNLRDQDPPIVTPPTHDPRELIPRTPLLTGTPFGARLSAHGVLRALARGMRRGGLPEPDVCPLEVDDGRCDDVRERLAALDFDARLRAARAVVIVAPRLDEHTLVRSATFEIATHARQAGVPAYAVTAENALSTFDARVLDLQLILRARGAVALERVGRKLAGLI